VVASLDDAEIISGPDGTPGCDDWRTVGGATIDAGASAGKSTAGFEAIGVRSSEMLFSAAEVVSRTVGRGLEPEPGLGVGGSELFSRRKCGDAPDLDGTVLLRWTPPELAGLPRVGVTWP